MKTPAPMSLDTMRAFAQAQITHYTELVRVLDKIKADPLSVLPHLGTTPPSRRGTRAPRRTREQKSAGAPLRTGASYATAAITALGPSSVREILEWSTKRGWTTTSATPGQVMHQQLKNMVEKGQLRKMKGPGKGVRWAMAKPSKAALSKLAAAEAMHATPVNHAAVVQ